ncbi:unnamed protein product [Lasius platythorax]|uniref:Uncharacterized protein n=1 Tax=Lasius platythorax TaxID=488582 RepID=A0AAV2MZ27_9HYME
MSVPRVFTFEDRDLFSDGTPDDETRNPEGRSTTALETSSRGTHPLPPQTWSVGLPRSTHNGHPGADAQRPAR